MRVNCTKIMPGGEQFPVTAEMVVKVNGRAELVDFQNEDGTPMVLEPGASVVFDLKLRSG